MHWHDRTCRPGGGDLLVYAIVAYPHLEDEERAGSVLLKTKRYVADIIVCVGDRESEIASIARMAGARVLESHNRPQSSMKLLETVHTLNPDVLILADGACDPNNIPRLLDPMESGADIVEAPWTGFRAFSKRALTVLVPDNGSLEVPSSKGLTTIHLPDALNLSSDTSAGQSILTILGVILLAMGLLLAAIVAVKLAEGVFYMDNALLAAGIVIVGIIVIFAGRKLSAIPEVADARS